MLAGAFFLATRIPLSGGQTSPGRIVDTRVVLVGTREGGEARPGQALYRGEAHVIYEANGRNFDTWLPATDLSPAREWLLFTLARYKGKVTEVHWKLNSPQKGFIVLQASDR